MHNSYRQSFGEPIDEASEEICELAFGIFQEFDLNASVEENAERFRKVVGSLVLSKNDKAHILDRCFNDANENFYELEDEGIDSARLQSKFLNAIEKALS